MSVSENGPELAGSHAAKSALKNKQQSVLRRCYSCSMVFVAARELRNDTAGVLRRVQGGEEVTVTVHGKPVAQLIPLPPPGPRWLPRAELARRLRTAQADPALRDDLERLAGETTDDLPPA